MNELPYKIIVVLTAGRSGSSLLMRVLDNLGLALSENLIAGRYENPEGYFEDKDIVEVHKKLYKRFFIREQSPLPDNWLKTEAVDKAKNKLIKIIQDRVKSSPNIWGFKDPRTCSFLPLWNRVFNKARVIPKFIIAVRNPQSVVVSQKKFYDVNEDVVEFLWLQRTIDALYHSAADCYIVHYEDWFTDGEKIASELFEFTGLNSYFPDIQHLKAIINVVNPNLNRSAYDDYEVRNEYVKNLYNVLKECKGSDFDQDRLMLVVQECHKTLQNFQGWYRLINPPGKRGDLQKMAIQNNHLLLEQKALFDETENLRKRLAALSEKSAVRDSAIKESRSLKRQIQNLTHEAIELKKSYSFRLGQIIINAVMRPGKNTILLPYYLLKLARDMVYGRG